MTKTREKKIGKLIFLSIQHILHLSCKFDHFWIFFFILMHAKLKRFFWNAVDTNLFRLGSPNPKKNLAPGCILLVGGEASHQKQKKILLIFVHIFFSHFTSPTSEGRASAYPSLGQSQIFQQRSGCDTTYRCACPREQRFRGFPPWKPSIK